MSEEEKKAIEDIKRELTDKDRREYMSNWFANDLDIIVNLIEKQNKELEPIRELNIPLKTVVAELNRLEDLEDDREEMQLIINELRKDSIPKSVIREEIEKLERDTEKIREKKKAANDYDRSKARMQAYLTKTNEIKKRLKELLGDEQ